jgi:hypothetical protein
MNIENPRKVSAYHPVPDPKVIASQADEVGLAIEGLFHKGHDGPVIAVSFNAMAGDLFEPPHLLEISRRVQRDCLSAIVFCFYHPRTGGHIAEDNMLPLRVPFVYPVVIGPGARDSAGIIHIARRGIKNQFC